MPIYASLVSRGSVILAEYNPNIAAFGTIARKLVEQIPVGMDNKKSYSYDSYNFHYMVERGIIYLCMTDQKMGYRIPYSFLTEVANRFRSSFGEKVMTAGAGAFNDTFSRVLQERMEFFSNDRNADKINKVKGEIEDAKTVMVKNIEKVLERGEKIEILVDKTEDLNNQSQSFKKKSTQLKRKMWWQNCKLLLVLICIVAVILISIILGLMYHFGVFSSSHSGGSNHESTTGSTTGSANSTMPANIMSSHFFRQ